MVESKQSLHSTAAFVDSESTGLTAPVANVILVHGIGEILPGDVLEAAVAGIKKAVPGTISETPSEAKPEDKPRDVNTPHIRSVSLTWGVHRFTVTEFHWNDETRKMRWGKNPFNAIRKFVAMIGEVPTLGLNLHSPGFAKRGARLLSRLLQLISCCIIAGAPLMFLVFLMVEAFNWVLPNRAVNVLDPPLWPLVLSFGVFSVGIVGLFLVGLGSLIVVGIQFVSRLGFPGGRQGSRVAFASSVASAILALLTPFGFMFILLGTVGLGINVGINDRIDMIVIEVVAALTGGLAVDPETLALSVVKLVLVCVVFILLCWMFIGLYRQLEVVINLLADVIHYFATDDHGKVKPPQRNIQSALWKLIERCNRDSPSSRIVLVAHSLGTVIVTDLLTMQRSENPDRPDLAIDLVTAGSPLRRLIHRMMPHRMDAPPVVRRTLRAVRGVRVKRWFNCFRAHDIVGKALSDPPSGLPWRERRFGWGDSAEAISERPLQPGRGLPNGHSNYWSDSRFLEVIGREVIEPLLPARSAMAQHAPPDSPPATPGSDQRN